MKDWTNRISIITFIIIVIFSFVGCAAAPDYPFIVGPNTYLNDFICIHELERSYIFKKSFSLDDNVTVSIDAKVHFPSIEETSFIVAPSMLDMDRILPKCMDTNIENVDCIETKEGFQNGMLYSFDDKTLAINNDDGFFTFFSTKPPSKKDAIRKRLSKEEAISLALDFIDQTGLSDNICETPVSINYLDDRGVFEIIFGKSYFGIPAETRSYTNPASTQGFPVDGEYITLHVSSDGIEDFSGIIKKVVKYDEIREVVSLDAIVNNFSKYIMLIPFSIGDHLAINQIELKYVATPVPNKMWNSRYVLAWLFSGSTNEGMPYFIYVNALDGSIIG